MNQSSRQLANDDQERFKNGLPQILENYQSEEKTSVHMQFPNKEVSLKLNPDATRIPPPQLPHQTVKHHFTQAAYDLCLELITTISPRSGWRC